MKYISEYAGGEGSFIVHCPEIINRLVENKSVKEDVSALYAFVDLAFNHRLINEISPERLAHLSSFELFQRFDYIIKSDSKVRGLYEWLKKTPNGGVTVKSYKDGKLELGFLHNVAHKGLLNFEFEQAIGTVEKGTLIDFLSSKSEPVLKLLFRRGTFNDLCVLVGESPLGAYLTDKESLSTIFKTLLRLKLNPHDILGDIEPLHAVIVKASHKEKSFSEFTLDDIVSYAKELAYNLNFSIMLEEDVERAEETISKYRKENKQIIDSTIGICVDFDISYSRAIRRSMFVVVGKVYNDVYATLWREYMRKYWDDNGKESSLKTLNVECPSVKKEYTVRMAMHGKPLNRISVSEPEVWNGGLSADTVSSEAIVTLDKLFSEMLIKKALTHSDLESVYYKGIAKILSLGLIGATKIHNVVTYNARDLPLPIYNKIRLMDCIKYVLDFPECEKSQRFLTVMSGSYLGESKIKRLSKLPDVLPENTLIDKDPLGLESFDIAGGIAPLLSAELHFEEIPNPQDPNKVIRLDRGEIWRLNLPAWINSTNHTI